MLDKLREISINLWSPVGDIFSSIYDSSSIWVPIISFIVVIFLILVIVKKILDMTVNGASSLGMTLIWSFIKKVILYLILIGIGSAIVVSLYFYIESIYTEHEEETIRVEQSVDYLLL